MTANPLKLVFMGTPDFAVPSLVALDQSRHRILRVITQPDRPKGRGRRVKISPVKETALQLGYDIAQPASAQGDDFISLCFDPDPDLLVVVAYGNILPKTVVSHPPFGVVNVHASLLPLYRGAAPIQWAIINGDSHTGITTMHMDAGMGRMTVSPVKETALRLGYDIFQPPSAKGDDFLTLCFEPDPDLLVVVAYGQIIPETVVTRPPHGVVNVHASLLPLYRGAAPIQWAIINGDSHTGITTMHMDAGMDTGDILLTARTSIRPDDTAASLHDCLAGMGAELLVDTLDRLAAGDITPIPQDDSQATYAPLLKKKDGEIDWHRSAMAIERLIRGMTPWPGAYTFQEGRRLKIFRTVVVDSTLPFRKADG